MLEIIAFAFFIEVGYMPQSQVLTYVTVAEMIDESQQFYIELGGRLYFWDMLYVGGSAKIHMWPEALTDWHPHKLDSLFEIGIEYGAIEFGFRHWCKHPIVPYLSEIGHFNSVDEVHEEIFLRVEGKI